MSQVIRIDDDVWAALQKQATPLVDTPNSVLRRILQLPERAPSPSTKNGAGVDQFGFRLGTETAAFNRVLSATQPKTMAQIVKEAGMKRGVYGHVKRMIERGFLKETKNGYLLTGKSVADSGGADG
jgi:hypothetical protein